MAAMARLTRARTATKARTAAKAETETGAADSSRVTKYKRWKAQTLADVAPALAVLRIRPRRRAHR